MTARLAGSPEPALRVRPGLDGGVLGQRCIECAVEFVLFVCLPWFPLLTHASSVAASFSRRIWRARKTRDRTAASLIPSVAATSLGDISSIVDKISGCAQLFGQRRDHPLQRRADLSAVHGLHPPESPTKPLPRTAFPDPPDGISRVRAALPAPVDRDSPGDSRQPCFRIFHGCELRAVAQHSHKRFLGGVFGIVMAAQHGIGDAVDQPGVLADQRFERSVALQPVALNPTALVFSARACSIVAAPLRIASPATTRLPSLMKTARGPFCSGISGRRTVGGRLLAQITKRCRSERLCSGARNLLFCRPEEAGSSLRSE